MLPSGVRNGLLVVFALALVLPKTALAASSQPTGESADLGTPDGAPPGKFDVFDIFDEEKGAVVSATKIASHASEAPAVVTVITEDQLRAYGYTSLADALRHVLGFYVVDDGILPNVAVRGVSGGLDSESGIIKVMIDGQSTAFRTTAGNWLGPELVPLSMVSRIEILRGPASALYGADAFLGVINVITKHGAALNGAVFGGGGGFVGKNSGYDFDAAVGDKKNNWDYALAARNSPRGSLRAVAANDLAEPRDSLLA